MAYTYADVYRIAAIGTARTIEDSRHLYILTAAQNFIWKKYDWRFTVGTLNNFWLIPYEQDYGRPIVVVPDNMERILRCQSVNWNETGVPIINPIEPRRELNPNDLIGMPQQVSFNSSSRSLRFWPRPGGGICAPNYMVSATYKTFPPVINTTTYQTSVIPSSDDGDYNTQVEMWVNVVRLMYYQVTGEYEKAQMQFGIAMNSIMEEAKNEGIDQGDPQIAPSESLLNRTGDLGFYWP